MHQQTNPSLAAVLRHGGVQTLGNGLVFVSDAQKVPLAFHIVQTGNKEEERRRKEKKEKKKQNKKDKIRIYKKKRQTKCLQVKKTTRTKLKDHVAQSV